MSEFKGIKSLSKFNVGAMKSFLYDDKTFSVTLKSNMNTHWFKNNASYKRIVKLLKLRRIDMFIASNTVMNYQLKKLGETKNIVPISEPFTDYPNYISFRRNYKNASELVRILNSF